jgi:hypothetical protein
MITSTSHISDAINETFFRLLKDDNMFNRTEFYTLISSYIASELKKKPYDNICVLDKLSIAHDTATQLWEKTITGNFVLPIKKKSFLWLNYLRNLTRTIIRKYNYGTLKQVPIGYVYDVLLYEKTSTRSGLKYEVSEDNTLDEYLKIKTISNKVYDQLLCFYSKEEIEKLLVLSTAYLAFKDFSLIISAMQDSPDEIKNFCNILYCTARRLLYKKPRSYKEHSIKEITNALKKATSSTLFLASLANTNLFPLPLLLSLDLKTLERLITVAGGQRLRIPERGELTDLMTYVKSMEHMITTNSYKKESFDKIAREYKMVRAKTSVVDNFVDKAFKTIGESDEYSEPIMNSLINSLNFVNTLLDNIDIAKLDIDNNTGVKYYVELNNIINTSLLSLINIKNKYNEEVI